MASYTELYDLHRDQDELLHKIAVALWVSAEMVNNEPPGTTNHANRLIWAAEVLADDGLGHANQMLRAILAVNAGLTVGQITGAADSAIQGKVDAAINLIAGS